MSIELRKRELDFLRESNAIEDIDNIDYANWQNAQPGRGHVGAFLEARQAAQQHRLIALDDICRFQAMVTEEQAHFGHSIPSRGIGKLRGPDAPFNVRVGMHLAPEYPAVASLMGKWLHDLQARLTSPDDDRPVLIRTADVVGELFQRFESIHPFVDGNGRVGRLVATYLTLFLGFPLIVFRADERPAFYAAHRSKPAMKLFIAQKLRETGIHPLTNKMLRRVRGDLATDVYVNDDGTEFIVEGHDLVPALMDWKHSADEKDRAAGRGPAGGS